MTVMERQSRRQGEHSNNNTAEPRVENRKRKASDDGEALERKIRHSTIITESSASQSTSTDTNSPSSLKVKEDVSTDEEDISHNFGSILAEEERIYEMASSSKTNRTEFESKYCKIKSLGSGSFGSVYSECQTFYQMVNCEQVMMVDAAINLHSKGVFHRDIKPQNILCQFESGQLKMRVIDFDCGSFSTERPFTSFSGTHIHASLEWLDYRTYWARPTTRQRLFCTCAWPETPKIVPCWKNYSFTPPSDDPTLCIPKTTF
ncbi:hypothetical protein L3Q82_021814, partial [Scortum barcoo]